MVLVNEIYPIDCVQYRLIVDPTHPYYQVDRGDPSQTGDVTPSATQSSEGHSLPLKPAKRKNAGPLETPPRNTELGGKFPNTPLRQPVFRTQIAQQMTNDALDDAIKEAQNLEHLVSHASSMW